MTSSIPTGIIIWAVVKLASSHPMRNEYGLVVNGESTISEQ